MVMDRVPRAYGVGDVTEIPNKYKKKKSLVMCREIKEHMGPVRVPRPEINTEREKVW